MCELWKVSHGPEARVNYLGDYPSPGAAVDAAGPYGVGGYEVWPDTYQGDEPIVSFTIPTASVA